MTPGWWLVEQFSCLLEPADREAVRGDLAETRSSSSRAALDVLDLVLRRQAELWKDWRPWLALIAFVAPVSAVLTGGANYLGSSYDMLDWILENSRDIFPTHDPFFAIGPRIAGLAWESLLLLAWAWACGYVLAALSRRTLAMNGTLFAIGLLWFALQHTVPQAHYTVEGTRFLTLNRVIFPAILQVVLVFLPAIWGMRSGLRPPAPHVQVLLWTAATATALLPGGQIWWAYWVGVRTRLVLLPIYWPLAYLIVTTLWRRWRSKPPVTPDSIPPLINL